MRPRKIDLSSTPPLPQPPIPVIFLLTIPRRCFCCGLLFLSLYVFACMPWWTFILDNRFANLGKKLSFWLSAFEFWLWCRCFKCVIPFLCCFWRKVLGNCIGSWSSPSFLLWKFQKKKKQNLLKICLQVTYPINFCIICIHFYCGSEQ